MSQMSKIFINIKGFVDFWFIVKLTLILICVGMFYWNSTKIIKRYMEYNTMVMVEFKQPNETQMPAITICAYSFISDESLSSDYWDEWYNYTDSISSIERYAIRQKVRAKALEDKTVEEIFNDTSITFESIVAECFFYPSYIESSIKKIPCNQITSTVESIYNGRKCFTIFSHLNITKEKYPIVNMEFEMQPFLQLNMANQLDTYFTDHLSDESTVYCIHSPNIIPSYLDAKCFLAELEKGLHYDTRFKKLVSHLKPAPYKTNCKWYNQDNPPGERSFGDCFNRCIKRLTFDTCFDFFSVVTKDLLTGNNQKICPQTNRNDQKLAEARVICSDRCQLTCLNEVIDIPFADFVRTTSSDTSITIQSSTMQYSFVYHKEAIDNHDFTANLGAHAHIWLGLSAIKIFNWTVHLIHYMRRYFSK